MRADRLTWPLLFVAIACAPGRAEPAAIAASPVAPARLERGLEPEGPPAPLQLPIDVGDARDAPAYPFDRGLTPRADRHE